MNQIERDENNHPIIKEGYKVTITTDLDDVSEGDILHSLVGQEFYIDSVDRSDPTITLYYI